MFCAVFIALSMNSYTRTSAAWDEPVHLVDGYTSLAEVDYRYDSEHPPLMRMWAALPLAVTGVPVFNASPQIDANTQADWFGRMHRMATDLLYSRPGVLLCYYMARFMGVLIGCALGVLVFLWTREWLGETTAIVVLALFALEPNLGANASIVGTDMGCTCFIFGALFLWRTVRSWTRANVAWTCVFFALAVITKFTAILLCVFVVLLIALAAAMRRLEPIRALQLLGCLAGSAYVAIWAIYRFRYEPSANADWLFTVRRSDRAVDASDAEQSRWLRRSTSFAPERLC